MTPKSLAIVTTVHPCAGTMQAFLAAAAAWAATQPGEVELILVDDLGAGAELAAQARPPLPGLRVLRDRQGIGQYRAMLHGIAQVQGKCVVTLDPDMAGNLADIEQLLARHAQGYELVLTWRVQRHDTPWPRRLASQLLNRLTRSIAGIPLHDINSPMRLFSPAAAQALLEMQEDHETFSLQMYRRFADRVAEVAIHVAAPAHTRKSSYRPVLLLGLFLRQLRAAWQFRRHGAAGGDSERSAART